MAGEAHRIVDLARPRLPAPLRLANAVAAPFARSVAGLELEELLRTAHRASGLAGHRPSGGASGDPYGDTGFREPLGVWLDALEREGRLSPLGRVSARQLVLGLLTTRLRLFRLLAAHPEIEEQPVEAPIVVMGLPRSGTTHLHSLLAADPSLRSLPYWESLDPIPPEIPATRPSPVPPEQDPRRRRCIRAMKLLHWAMPLFPRMHEMEADACHEEIQLLAVEFRSMLFEASHTVPSYRDWYRASDQTPAYRTLRRLLQVLQWLDGRPRRWVLKSPQHLEQIGPLLAVFPDAKIVQTHRDPVRVTASFCTLGAYGLRMNTRAVDVEAVGAYWAERIEGMLRASVEDRPRIPEAQIHDLRFEDFMRSEVDAVERVCAFAGHPFDDEARKRVVRYQETHPRGRHGTIAYRLEDFGIDKEERRRALAFYGERFGVSDL